MSSSYANRFERVFDFIDQNLDTDLSVERLSQVAHFSKHHFHRQFSIHAGISVAKYVQLKRLKRASYQLAFDERSRVIDIALTAGFESPESFARAFRHTFGQTPTQFRKQPAWKPWAARYRLPKPQRSAPMHVKIVEFPTTPIAVLEHRGPVDLLNDSVARFIDWRKQSNLSPVQTSQTFGIAHDDPNTTDPERFRFDVCGSVSGEVPTNPQGVINKVIPGGRCAVVRHVGAHDGLNETAYYLYREWLPDSGESVRDFPLFFQYRNLLPDTPEHELITDIHLPLQ